MSEILSHFVEWCKLRCSGPQREKIYKLPPVDYRRFLETTEPELEKMAMPLNDRANSLRDETTKQLEKTVAQYVK